MDTLCTGCGDRISNGSHFAVQKIQEKVSWAADAQLLKRPWQTLILVWHRLAKIDSIDWLISDLRAVPSSTDCLPPSSRQAV